MKSQRKATQVIGRDFRKLNRCISRSIRYIVVLLEAISLISYWPGVSYAGKGEKEMIVESPQVDFASKVSVAEKSLESAVEKDVFVEKTTSFDKEIYNEAIWEFTAPMAQDVETSALEHRAYPESFLDHLDILPSERRGTYGNSVSDLPQPRPPHRPSEPSHDPSCSSADDDTNYAYRPNDSAGPNQNPTGHPSNCEPPPCSPANSAGPTNNPTSGPNYPSDSARPTDPSCNPNIGPTCGQTETTESTEDERDETPCNTTGNTTNTCDQPTYNYPTNYPTNRPTETPTTPCPVAKVQVENTVSPVEDLQPLGAHCQASRLIILVGNPQDERMAAARDWATKLWEHQRAKNHLHIVRYDTVANGLPDMDHVFIPDGAAPNGWKRLDHLVGDDAYQTIEPDCCHFQEVLILMGARGEKAWTKVVDHLHCVFNYKPVRKLVLWSYDESKAFFPSTSMAAVPIYEKLCGLVRPKNCPCDCDPEKSKSFDAENNAERCPSRKQTIPILCAGAFDGRIANLSLDTKDTKNPFATPDGTLRTVTVDKKGVIRARLGALKGSIFGDLGVKTVAAESSDITETFYPKLYLRETRTIEKKDPKRYIGPQAGDGREGCFLDSGEK